jgi:phosphatidylinositol 3,5-bisphosphate 5-phosphatase
MESYRDIEIYDLGGYFLVIGRSKFQNVYKVIKIKKLPITLEIQEVKRSFTKAELDSYLKNIFHDQQKPPFITAEVILGVKKFLQGFYLFIVTKKTKVGVLRGKSVYKISSAKLLKLFSEKKTKDEKRYLDIFYSLDLQLGFYFSYTYDLTHTLQENIITGLSTSQPEKLRARAKTFHSISENAVDLEQEELYTWKTIYVWNHDMISSLYSILTDKNWIAPMIHGYVGHRCISLLGRKYDILLISRRSRYFAGTRYLKRGLSEEGKVANDVETEQILIEKIPNGKITSYVQHRGSVPLFWCQDPNSMLPSPPIILNQNDFLHEGTTRHFSDLFQRYGTPIILINLLRLNDKNKEYNLSLEYKNTVDHLNEQISFDNKVQYNSFDIKNEIKKSKKNYEEKFYHEFKDLVPKTSVFTAVTRKGKIECGLQVGVIRTNCVDCIDRTNEGQQLIAHLALEYQLKVLGISDSLSKKSDIVQLLTKMFEEMGDVIALQYSGSIAHKSANSKEKSKQYKIIVATKRHLANLMKDSKKQQAINLFLGIYKTDLYAINLWDISDDFRLHNKLVTSTRIYTKWWKHDIQKYYNRLGLKKEKFGFNRSQSSSFKSSVNKSKVFNYDKNLLIDSVSKNISNLDKKIPHLNSEVIEISITEENSEKIIIEEEPKHEIKKKSAWKNNLIVSAEEIELFESYAKLSEIDVKDNFQLAIVHEEISADFKDFINDDFSEYLNTKIDARKLLKEFDDEDNDDDKEIEPEIIDLVIIDCYLDQYQPPSFFKCIHYQEYRSR